MIQLLFTLLPTGLSAAVGQRMIIRMVHLQATSQRPRWSACCFLLGAAIYCLAVATVVLFLTYSGMFGQKHINPFWGSLIYLILSALFIVLACREIWTRPDPSSATRLYRRIAALSAASGWRVFLAGFVGQIFLFRSLLFLITALKQISDAQLGLSMSVLAFIAYLLCSFFLYEIPLLYYFVVPDQATRTLKRASRWYERHDKAISILIDLFMAYILLRAGLKVWF